MPSPSTIPRKTTANAAARTPTPTDLIGIDLIRIGPHHATIANHAVIVFLAEDGNPDAAVVLNAVLSLIQVLLGILVLPQGPTLVESRRSHLTILRWNWMPSEKTALITGRQSNK